MWRKLKNFLSSLTTYHTLSPDLKLRQQVNQMLLNRPALSLDAWFKAFWQPRGISHRIAAFVYAHLGKYSGLSVSRVKPGDRLDEDLKLTFVCWFDWHLVLCDDFQTNFGIDISECFDCSLLLTMEDLVQFLEHQLPSVNCH
ncbi:MAG: hypothetical protein F6K19_23600 [Cyanothece sp. SIO1E1]|nr:hypothetical protein [Cyanothece sp. SIO1E1]